MANLTNLASGSSVVLTVTDQQQVVLNNGRTDVARLQITTGPGAGQVVTASHNGRRVYGPFGAGTVTLSAVSGNVRYELSGDTASPLDDDGQPLTSTENQTVRALASGAGSRARYANQILNAGRPLRLETWGNSWENSAVLWSALVGSSSGKLGWIDEQGVSGERPDEILTRLQTTGPSSTADVYSLGEGTNAAYSGYTVAAYIGYMEQCAQILIETGKPVILRTTPPTTGDASAQALTHQYWLAEILMAERLGIICLDLSNRAVATDGQIVAAANDGTNKHLTGYYYALCGQDGWTDLDAGNPVKLIPRTNASLGYGGTNVLLLTDSNADNRPDAWSTFYGGTFTTGPTWAALADLTYPYRGKRASVAMKWPSGIAYVNRSDVAMSGQDGKTMRVAGMLKVAANVGNNGVTVVELLTYTAGSVLTGTFRVATLVGTTNDLYLQTDFVVPAGTTKYTLTFRTSGSAAGDTEVTLQFGCWDVVPVTDYTF